MRADVVGDQRISRLRERFLATGAFDDSDLSPYVARSWQRSQAYGLSVSDHRLADAVQIVSPGRVKESDAQLIRCAQPEIEQLRHTFGDHHWVIACTNAEGIIVHSIGSGHSSLRSLSNVLCPGTNVSEKMLGTNGPGSALIEQRPMLVRGGEHFLDELNGYSCASVPFADPFGKLFGVLNVSYLYRPLQADPLALLSSAARAIENQMIVRLPDCTIVRFHCRPDLVETSHAGMIALDAEGNFIAANRSARLVLGLGNAGEHAPHFSSHFDASLASLLQAGRFPALPVPVWLDSGVRVYAYARERAGKTAEQATRTQSLRPDTANLGEDGRDDAPFLNLDSRMELCFNKARKALAREVPVIVLGETGTGKEVLVRRLHDTSPRQKGPLVAINCCALPGNLIESELFGHEYGAFTGARRGGAAGKIEQAHRGTLFLDEIGDLPLELQGRLLRVLQERKVARLGGDREIPVEFSLVCATHQPLHVLVSQGRFREDLYYRISGVTVTLPPLRERSDLLQLISWMLSREARIFGLRDKYRLDREALGVLQAYAWPGNVRQLHSVLHSAAALADDDMEIRLEHLPDELRKSPASARSVPESEPFRADHDTLASREEAAIRQMLDRHNGNVSAAARALGISRATLHRKLRLM